MIEPDLLKRLLEKYRFIEEIPEQVQRLVFASRKRVLRSSLKAVGDLGIFYRMVISVYHDSRRFGFRPSISLSKIIAYAITAAITLTITAGILLAATRLKILRIQTEEIIKTSQKSEVKMINLPPGDIGLIQKRRLSENIAAKNEKGIGTVKTRLGIINITPAGVGKDKALAVSKRLYKDLLGLKGGSRVVNITKSRGTKSINRHLLGRLSRIDETYILAVRIIDSESGEVLYDKTITYTDENTINKKLESMVQEIDKKADIWE